jgi:hypothetical protein
MDGKTQASGSDRMITMATLLDRHPELRPTPEERRRAGVGSTPLGVALRRGAYSPPRAASIGKRTAAILLWAARLYPGQYIDYADLSTALLGVSRRVTALRLVKEIVSAGVSGARAALGGRGAHFVMTVRGVGVRCTVDRADAKENYLPRVQVQMLRALRSLLHMSECIELAKLTLESLHVYEETLQAAESVVADAEKRGVEVSRERQRLAALQDRLAEDRRLRGFS